MNKFEFLSVLRDRLSGLPKEDVEKSVDYYSEMIDDRIEEGLTEEEATAAVGSIENIVSQILMEISLPKLVRAKAKPNRSFKVWEIVLLILGSPVWLPLLIAALITVLAVYIVIWSVIIVLYSVDITFAVSSIAGICGSLAYIPSGNFAQGALFFGAGLICAGVAILLLFGFNQITKGVLALSKKILLGFKGCFLRRGDVQ